MCDATWLAGWLPAWVVWWHGGMVARWLGLAAKQPQSYPLPAWSYGQALYFGAQNEFKLKSCEHFVGRRRQAASHGNGSLAIGSGKRLGPKAACGFH